MTASTSPPLSLSPSSESNPDRWRWASLPAWLHHPIAAGLALCGMVAVSYYPALFGGFVIDDNIFADSPAVHAWSGLWNIWFSPDDLEGERHYWPILYTTFWLEHKLWGLAPFGYHLVNVLLYMVNVLLLWVLLRRLAVPGAWAVAAVFAVHPMHVDSVAWVIGRKDLLSGLFCMAAALCWMRSTASFGVSRTDCPDDLLRVPWRWLPDSLRVPRPALYFAAVGLFAAAMLSKSVAVTLPVAFVIVIWWKQGRVTWTDGCRIAPFLLVALCISLADLSYYTSGPRELDFDYGFAERALIAARALWYYAGKLAWPADLAVVGPLWELDTGDLLAWVYLIAAVAVAALLWFARHRVGRGPLAGAVFFVVTLSPVLGFVDYGHMWIAFAADRYAYLAGIGVISVVVGGVAYCLGKLPSVVKIGAAGVLVAVLAVFGRLTWEQAGIYRDDLSFYNHIISRNPGARFAHWGLFDALIDAGRTAEALAASRIAMERFPESVVAHNAHGVALMELNRLEEAAESFRRAAELGPGHKSSRQNLGSIRRRQGRFAESIRWYRAVLDIDPDYTLAHVGMGAALFSLRQHEQAEESLARAVSLGLDAVPISALSLLGDAQRKQQRYEEAIDTYRGILETDPGYAPAHAGIGYALLGLTRYEEAVESLARAISLRPELPANADLHAGIGEASRQLGRTEVAAEHYARALTIDSGNANALDFLALLRFRQQRYDEALRLFERLIEVDETNAQVHVNMSATLYYLDRPEEALRSLDRARSLDPALRTRFEGMRDTPGRG